METPPLWSTRGPMLVWCCRTMEGARCKRRSRSKRVHSQPGRSWYLTFIQGYTGKFTLWPSIRKDIEPNPKHSNAPGQQSVPFCKTSVAGVWDKVDGNQHNLLSRYGEFLLKIAKYIGINIPWVLPKHCWKSGVHEGCFENGLPSFRNEYFTHESFPVFLQAPQIYHTLRQVWE